MNSEKNSTLDEEQWKPGPAESFSIDYLNQRIIEAQNALSALGFRKTSSGVEADDSEKVYITGESLNGDGTTIRIEITKGENYKTPAELEKEKEND